MNYNYDFYNKMIRIYEKNESPKMKAHDILIQKGILEIAEKYTEKLLSEEGPVIHWGIDPENYYFQIGSHCYSAGLITRFWLDNADGYIDKEKTAEALMTIESVQMAPLIANLDDTFSIDIVRNIRFDKLLNELYEYWDWRLDNSNEYMISGLLAMFMNGASEDLEFFRSSDDSADDDNEYIKERSTSNLDKTTDLEEKYNGKKVDFELFREKFEPNGSDGIKKLSFRYYFDSDEDEEYFLQVYSKDDPRFYYYLEIEDEDSDEEEDIDYEYDEDYYDIPFPEISLFPDLKKDENGEYIISDLGLCKVYPTGWPRPGVHVELLTDAESFYIQKLLDKVIID